MSLALFSFAAAFCVMLASIAGVLFATQTLGTWMRKHLTYLTTFSAGVLTVLAYHLVEETFLESPSMLVALSAVAAGFIILEAAHWGHTDTHHHHDEVDHPHSALDGRRVLASDAVHNLTDGFLIVPAFLIDWKIGVAATVGIFFHELVQEVSEFFILKEAGYTTRSALMLNFVISATVLVGVALALSLASFDTLVAVLSGLAAGGFIAVVARDLLPHAYHSAKKNRSWFPHVLAATSGLVVMTTITALLPH